MLSNLAEYINWYTGYLKTALFWSNVHNLHSVSGMDF